MKVYRPKDLKLFNYCETFFRKALEVLKKYIKKGGHIPLKTFYEPVIHINKEGKSEGIKYVAYEEKDFDYFIFQNYKELLDLPELKSASDYISKNKYLFIGRTDFASDALLTKALRDYLRKTASIDYREREFLDIYAKIENLIFSNEIQFRITAKLENFSCTENLVELDKIHSIKSYTQENCKEICRHPSINIYDPKLPVPGDFRIEVAVSKDKSNWGVAEIEGTKAIKDVLTVLRLFKDSDIAIVTLESEPITWFPFTSERSSRLLPLPGVGDKCLLQKNEVGELKELWKMIKNINYKNCPSLEIAIKRFNYAHEHKNREDALIDTIIGLESLYLYMNERAKRDRLALRVATLLEACFPHYKEKRSDISKNVHKAYELRNHVVHGSKVAETEIWECRIVKKYLSDSIKLFAQLSQEYKHEEILKKD